MRLARRPLLSALPVVLGAALALPAEPLGAQVGGVDYQPPVDAPVVDPFREPTTPFGPGNRGLEYGTEPGTEVRAAAGGTVLFAGPVAGALHVTVLHADGLRTTYSFLATTQVAPGVAVRQGQLLGTTIDHLHFGVRNGEEYIDPALLFGGGSPDIRLVPYEDPDGGGLLSERAALLDFVAGLEPPLPALPSLASLPDVPNLLPGPSTASLLMWPDGQTIPLLLHYAIELRPEVRAARVGTGLVDWWQRRDDCTPTDVDPTPPAERRIVLLVGGLGTTSRGASIDGIDPEGLGYAPDDTIRFSYAGGRVPSDNGGPLADLPTTTYEKADTEGDLRQAGDRLRALLDQIAAAQPGVPIDIVAHSQGGVVARAALLDAAGLPPELEHLVTLGSPHQGTDLATGLTMVREAPLGHQGIDLVEQWRHTGLNPDGVSAGQLAETSTFIAELEATGPPPGVDFRSIGARGDLIVTAPHADASGGRHITLPLEGTTAHTRLASDPMARREVALAIADQPPTCETLPDVLVDLTVGETVSFSEDALAVLSLDLTGG